MILVGNQRGGSLKLAAHLMNDRENDHVELHELRGFVADTLRGALREADAISKGTKCEKPLFSLSISPPKTERVSTDDILEAVDRTETKLGLNGQARAIVFHEKNGRRHAHAVWLRINVEEMKAIKLPYYRTRLNEVSKALFLDHGWRLPDGYLDRSNRDPRNFSLAEWQQAKRNGKNAREIKQTFQEAWSISDTKDAFAHALEEKGYILARGNRGRYVAVDIYGEVYSVPRMTGLRTKQVREKLGDAKALRSVEEASAHIAETMQVTLTRWQEELEARQDKLKQSQEKQRQKLVQAQRAARTRLTEKLEKRRLREAKERQARFRTGLRGLWDFVRGEHRKIKRENERVAWQALQRDRSETDALIFRHLEERNHLCKQNAVERDMLKRQMVDIEQDRVQFFAGRMAGRSYVRGKPSLER